MAKILSLKELQVGMQRIQVICRLMKQWRVFNPITGMLGDYQFIFIDAEGSAVQAKMDPHTYGLLQFTFEEGKVYKLLKFRVVECPKEYKAVKNTVMIIFTTFSTAKALPETQPPLPLYYFDFVPFEDIGVSITYEKAIVDVIGRLLAVGPVQIVGDKESRVRNIDIANERNATLNITIWGDFIDQLGWDSLAQETTHPVVIIFSTMQLRDDKYRGIGLKTCSGTCFYLDSSIPQIAKFEKSIAHEQPPIVIQATHSQQLQPARVPRLTKQLSLAQLLNEDLSANERTNYKCVAEIVDFLNRVEWYYYGCPRCKSSVHTIQRVPKCNACTIDDQLLTKWYRLQLIVADGTAKSNFTVIGQTAEQLIGFSADTVAMDEDPDADDLPEKIISILHKRFLFTVNVNRLSLHASEPEFTVQKIEPVPSDAPDFVADIGSTSKLAIDQSNQLDSILPTQTGLTPLAKTMRITAAQHESHSQYFHSETNVSTSRSPKRKIDFQPERDQFSGDNQDEDKS